MWWTMCYPMRYDHHPTHPVVPGPTPCMCVTCELAINEMVSTKSSSVQRDVQNCFRSLPFYLGSSTSDTHGLLSLVPCWLSLGCFVFEATYIVYVRVFASAIHSRTRLYCTTCTVPGGGENWVYSISYSHSVIYIDPSLQALVAQFCAISCSPWK